VTYEQLTLHIGMPKTGTTTIQSFLGVNREHLHKQGLFTLGPFCLKSYPQAGEFFKEERLRAGLDELKERTRRGTDRILWSHEGLSDVNFSRDGKFPSIIEREIPASRYRIVIYLRRQDHFLRSAYLEWGIVGKRNPGQVVGFEDWLRELVGDNYQNLLPANVDYAGTIQPWIDVFGSESVVVRVFEKGQMLNGDLLQDFCDAAEVPKEGCLTDIPNKNVSYNMELYDMLGMYNSTEEGAVWPGKMAAFVRDFGEDEFFSRPFFSRFAIPPKCRIEILQHCEPSNRKVAKEFLGREDGVLFREPWPNPDEPHRPYGGLTTEKLVPILLHMLHKQHEEAREQHHRICRLERLADQMSLTGIARGVTRRLTRGIANLATSARREAGETAEK
jgi:hypothetical protein